MYPGMKSTFLILILLIGALALFIRFQPPNAVAAHVDPQDLPDPGQGGVRLVGSDAPAFEATPEAVLTAFQETALAYPRTAVIAGSAEDGMITVVVRTATWAFQDYVTAQASQDGDTTRLTLAARTRYPGASDWGVNRNRLEKWLLEIAERLGEAG